MATEGAMEESVDATALEILDDVFARIVNLPDNCDADSRNEIINKIQCEQQVLETERVKKFNDAWNIQSFAAEDNASKPMVVIHSATTSRNSNVQQNANNTEQLFTRKKLPVSVGADRLGTGINSNINNPAKGSFADPIPASLKDNHSHLPPGSHVTEKKRASISDDELTMEHGHHVKSRRYYRSRDRSRNRSRDRSHGYRKRRHSYSRSRSPSDRRRKRRSRSSSQSLSRSRSRSRSHSRPRSPARRSRSRDSHGRSRSDRARAPDAMAMMQTMMSMTMQMFNKAMGTTDSGRPPVMPDCSTVGSSLEKVLNNKPLQENVTTTSNHSTSPKAVSVEVMTENAVSNIYDVDSPPKYDVSTELFLEGKLNINDFLALKPSTKADQLAPVNPAVSTRVKEAIAILEQQDTRMKTARFLHVPPTYYCAAKKNREFHRSPLIWNNQNVLFGTTSHLKEAKQCHPFSNVNGKLRVLIQKLGLDEGIISQRLQKSMQKITVNENDPAGIGSLVRQKAPAARIEAITTLAPKHGKSSSKVRHVIERSIQTDECVCLRCVAREKKTMVSSFSQTTLGYVRKDKAVQTNGPQISSNSISLDGLNPIQTETIEAIVNFVRSRQLAGSIESIEHALRWDRSATEMGATIQQNAQHLLSQVRVERQQQYQQRHHQQEPPLRQDERPRDPRIGVRNNSRVVADEQIRPACFAKDPMSKKAKKKFNQQRW